MSEEEEEEEEGEEKEEKEIEEEIERRRRGYMGGEEKWREGTQEKNIMQKEKKIETELLLLGLGRYIDSTVKITHLNDGAQQVDSPVVQNVVNAARSRLRWLGHVERMENLRKAKMVTTQKIEKPRLRGRPLSRCLECDLARFGIRNWMKQAEDQHYVQNKTVSSQFTVRLPWLILLAHCSSSLHIELRSFRRVASAWTLPQLRTQVHCTSNSSPPDMLHSPGYCHSYGLTQDDTIAVKDIPSKYRTPELLSETPISSTGFDTPTRVINRSTPARPRSSSRLRQLRIHHVPESPPHLCQQLDSSSLSGNRHGKRLEACQILRRGRTLQSITNLEKFAMLTPKNSLKAEKKKDLLAMLDFIDTKYHGFYKDLCQ
ncbi:hypothetical protein ANN_04818 [Periplaneta americana]|uniref:Uncharacterized protein n=1 Tax=Periplaneta americana TaxID=6978 RepID=A0ABQ8TAA2_PERAM|nr:hypothetical protein ANN_04818 [Periplaneta americana]